MKMVIYMVRHGQSESNIMNILQGQIDLPLTDLGHAQARATATRLAREPIAAVYASDLTRACETAAPIAEAHGLEVLPTPEVRECSLGEVQGLTVEQFAEKWPSQCRLWKANPLIHRPPGGERFEEVQERCGRFVDIALDRHRGDKAIVVVAHYGSIPAIIASALQMGVNSWMRIRTSNASISELEYRDHWTLRRLNDVCHLAGLEQQPNSPLP